MDIRRTPARRSITVPMWMSDIVTSVGDPLSLLFRGLAPLDIEGEHAVQIRECGSLYHLKMLEFKRARRTRPAL